MSYGADMGRVQRSTLPHRPKSVLAALLTVLENGATAGVATLAQLEDITSMSPDWCRAGLAELRAAGIVRQQRQEGGATLYELEFGGLTERPRRTPRQWQPLANGNPSPMATPRQWQPLASGNPTPCQQRGDPPPIATPPLANSEGSPSNRNARSCPSSVPSSGPVSVSHADAPDPEAEELVVEPDPELQTSSRLPELIAAATAAHRDGRGPGPAAVELLRQFERHPNGGAEKCLRLLQTACADTDRPVEMLRVRVEVPAGPAQPWRRGKGREDAAARERLLGRHTPGECSAELPAADPLADWPECPDCAGAGCFRCDRMGKVPPARASPAGPACRFCDNGRIGSAPCASCNGTGHAPPAEEASP